MSQPRFTIEPPLLRRLRRLNQEAAELFPTHFDPGLGRLGLILQVLGKGRYDFCTPLNCQPFAGTGGNGVHFSLMARDGIIDDHSPVICTNPGGGMGFSHVVGEDLLDFLCLGYRRGYFALEQLQYNERECLEAYTNPIWLPTERHHDSVGYVLADDALRILQFLIDQFSLRPWVDGIAKFRRLQEKYQPLLQMPEDD